MGSTSLSLLIVRLVVSRCLMPRFADFGSGVEGGGGDGEPASPLAEKLLTALRVSESGIRDSTVLASRENIYAVICSIFSVPI